MRKWLLRWLLPDQIYVAVRIYPQRGATVLVAHTTLQGVNEDMAGVEGQIGIGNCDLVVD